MRLDIKVLVRAGFAVTVIAVSPKRDYVTYVHASASLADSSPKLTPGKAFRAG